MSPVTASRDDNGKVVLQFSSWLIPVILLLVTTAGSFVIGTLRAEAVKEVELTEVKAKIEVNTQAIQNLPEQFVGHRQYSAEISALRNDINRIDRNVEKLLDYQTKQYETRRTNPTRP
jgi:hypothetical protein